MSSDRTALGDRIKGYEALSPAAGTFMPGLPLVARVDGRHFSRWTRGLDRPFDKGLAMTMIETTKRLVQETGARVGYTQSDEITLVFVTDKPEQQLPFGGKAYKVVSHLAAMATAYFQVCLYTYLTRRVTEGSTYFWHDAACPVHWVKPGLCACGHLDGFDFSAVPTFDARAFSVPTLEEAANVLLWRERDATRNSISMLAQAHYSHKQLFQKNTAQMQDMLHEKGVNWNDQPDFFKRGTYVRRSKRTVRLTPEQVEKIPPPQRAQLPDPPVVERMVVDVLLMEPLSRYVMPERLGVLFGGVDPADVGSAGAPAPAEAEPQGLM